MEKAGGGREGRRGIADGMELELSGGNFVVEEGGHPQAAAENCGVGWSFTPLGIKSISSSQTEGLFIFFFFFKDSASRQRCSSHDST